MNSIKLEKGLAAIANCCGESYRHEYAMDCVSLRRKKDYRGWLAEATNGHLAIQVFRGRVKDLCKLNLIQKKDWKNIFKLVKKNDSLHIKTPQEKTYPSCVTLITSSDQTSIPCAKGGFPKIDQVLPDSKPIAKVSLDAKALAILADTIARVGVEKEGTVPLILEIREGVNTGVVLRNGNKVDGSIGILMPLRG